jgi:DNA-binding NtrC family response regulator
MDTNTGKSQVLVVDDEKSIRLTLKEFLEDEGFMVTTADGFAEAMKVLKACDFDVAVIDRVLSNGHSGLDIIKHMYTANPFCQTILVTAYPTIESAQFCLKYGTSDCFVKPVAQDDICTAVKAASHASLQQRRKKAVFLKQNLQNR